MGNEGGVGGEVSDVCGLGVLGRRVVFVGCGRVSGEGMRVTERMVGDVEGGLFGVKGEVVGVCRVEVVGER